MKRLGLVFAVLIAVTACGDDTADTSTTGGPGGPEFVTVIMDDFFFDPETVTVRAGALVNVTAENTGGTVHTWTVLTEGDEVRSASGLDPSRVIVSVEADDGQIGTGSFTAPGPGIYQVICLIIGHVEAGATGTLIVEG